MVGEAAIMRAALERLADLGQPIAIQALIEIDGHSRYAQSVRELWAAQGAYGHRPPPSRTTQRKAELERPVDPDYERWARRELAWNLREAWREIWAACGAPVTVIRIKGAGQG